MAEVAAARRAKRSSLTSSPLARPQSLIHKLAADLQDYIYCPHPDHVYVALATLVANMMRGNTVWVMFVGASSTGKNTVLDTLVKCPKVFMRSKISGEAALLSGTKKSEVAKGAKGGLLREIGLRGVLVMRDFTSVLSMDYKNMTALIGALREVFDGHWTRTIGGEGGRDLAWGYPERGHVGFIGSCTPAIDARHSIIQELGQRWLYYRYPHDDGFGQSLAALRRMRRQDQMDDDLSDTISGFINTVAEWDMELPRELDKVEEQRLIHMATLMVRVRSTVTRDRGGSREINAPTNPEGPPRMTGSLGQLYLGLEVVGLDEVERWRIIGKVALDSAPQTRVMTVESLVAAGSAGLEVGDLREKLQCGKNTVTYLVEDLKVLGVVDRDENVVRLSSWARGCWTDGWQVPVQEIVRPK